MNAPRDTVAGTRYAGKRMLVVGLGASGVSALRHLTREGASVVVTDSREHPPGLPGLRDDFTAAEFRTGGFDAPRPLSDFAEAIVSPGVALDQPFVKELAAAGVPLIGDIELFARAAKAPVIGITGSNGKSTVTTLVGEMARAAGLRPAVGGNLGTPALDLLADDIELYVLELSSFQLETARTLVCKAATFLNLSEDHLDRHGTMKEYGAVKARIFRGCHQIVVNRDDDAVMRLVPPAARIDTFGLREPKGREYGIAVVDGVRWLAQGGHRMLPLADLRIQGLHNAANALAALALANAAGIPREPCLRALREFPGLPHRCEFVALRHGVTWLNDSKGTNVGSTLAALEGLDAPIVWLGGGQGKGQDFRPLARPLARKGRAALLFGQDAAVIEDAIIGALPVYRDPDMEAALARARTLAEPGDRVLLSPACASLDQFDSYVQRGQVFTRWVLTHA